MYLPQSILYPNLLAATMSLSTNGAATRSRIRNQFITNESLCQLSYCGIKISTTSMHLTETSYNHIWTVGCLYAAGSAGLPTAILLMSLLLSHLSASAIAGSLSFRCAPLLAAVEALSALGLSPYLHRHDGESHKTRLMLFWHVSTRSPAHILSH